MTTLNEFDAVRQAAKMDHMVQKLSDTYAALLAIPPSNEFRVRNQPLYASILDALASITGFDAELIQTQFERGATLHRTDFGFTFVKFSKFSDMPVSVGAGENLCCDVVWYWQISEVKPVLKFCACGRPRGFIPNQVSFLHGNRE